MTKENIKKTVTQMIVDRLRNRGFHVEIGKDGGIVFSLTSIGLSSIYAEVTAKEIEIACESYEVGDEK